MIKCFFVQAMNRFEAVLNRYGPVGGSSHCAARTGMDENFRIHEGNAECGALNGRPGFPGEEDPRWPLRCDHCGGIFDDEASRSMTTRRFYRNPATEEIFRTPLPVGAMYFETERPFAQGFDGRCLVVVIPDPENARRGGSGTHLWYVDGRASNCTVPCKCGQSYAAHYEDQTGKCDGYKPADDGAHRCWIRHGEPPLVTVNKQGVTCGAGAGSIVSPSGWHGWLRDGALVSC